MKAGVAMMVEVMRQIGATNYTDKKVMLMITSDEEIGGFDGVDYLTEQGYG